MEMVSNEWYSKENLVSLLVFFVTFVFYSLTKGGSNEVYRFDHPAGNCHAALAHL
jgi:hypothetical protein